MPIWWVLRRKVKKKLKEKKKEIDQEVRKAEKYGYKKEDIFAQLPYREVLHLRSIFQPTAREELKKTMEDPQADPQKKKIAQKLYRRAGNPYFAAPLNALIGADLLQKTSTRTPTPSPENS